MNYFILVSSDTEDLHGKTIAAYDVATSRLATFHWPLYRRTKNRMRVAPGDQCLFYIGGKKSFRQSIIGRAQVSSLEKAVDRGTVLTRLTSVDDLPSVLLKLENVVLLERPTYLPSVMTRLKFIPKGNRKWGSALQGGCICIPHTDFEILASGRIDHAAAQATHEDFK